MIEFVLVLFMNGWPTEVDRFTTMKECHEKMLTFSKSNLRPNIDFKIWCEQIKK